MTESRESVMEEFKKIIADVFNTSIDELEPSTEFVKDLNASSMSTIAMIAATEKKFGIKTQPAEVNKNKTIKQAVDYILEKLKSKE